MIDYADGSCGASGCEHWAYTDVRGSVIATTDENGDVRNQYTYSPYGVSNDDSGIPFRYTGQKLDAQSGLYYYKARWYDPEVGRFLQPDPIGYSDGMNLYAYVGGDPVNSTDPTGLLERGGTLIRAGGLSTGSGIFGTGCIGGCDDVAGGNARVCVEGGGCVTTARLSASFSLREFFNSPSGLFALSLATIAGNIERSLASAADNAREFTRCPVIEAQVSAGSQAGFTVEGGSGNSSVEGGIFLDAGTARLTLSTRGSGFSRTESVEIGGALNLGGIEVGRTFGEERSVPFGFQNGYVYGGDLTGVPFSEFGPTTSFIGISVGGAFLLGAAGEVGYDLPGEGQPCPAN